MERRHISDADTLSGYDTLRTHQTGVPDRAKDEWSFAPNPAYDTYLRMHKVLVGESGGRQLEAIAQELSGEWMPRYLDAAGWAAAEAALAQQSRPAVDRVQLINQAASCWERAMISQEQINGDSAHEWLQEDTASYRLALNLAFVPLMKSIAVGNVTGSVREKTFADTLAIAQASAVQRHMACQSGNIDGLGDHVGFGHECNALLTLLYMDDPRYVPLPSSNRAGTGYDYPGQTHDIVVINQHWGNILKTVPIEVKSRASLRDLKRYDALIVRGKMHLSVEGRRMPEHTLAAFAAMYEGNDTPTDANVVENVTSTMRELLQLYQKGKRVQPAQQQTTQTRFHDKTKVAEIYKEFSLDRANQKS